MSISGKLETVAANAQTINEKVKALINAIPADPVELLEAFVGNIATVSSNIQDYKYLLIRTYGDNTDFVGVDGYVTAGRYMNFLLVKQGDNFVCEEVIEEDDYIYTTSLTLQSTVRNDTYTFTHSTARSYNGNAVDITDKNLFKIISIKGLY